MASRADDKSWRLACLLPSEQGRGWRRDLHNAPIMSDGLTPELQRNLLDDAQGGLPVCLS